MLALHWLALQRAKWHLEVLIASELRLDPPGLAGAMPSGPLVWAAGLGASCPCKSW